MNLPYFRSLDGVRAFAVFIVLVAHAGAKFPVSGGMGVEVFFVLSGFLITSILRSEYEQRRSISFRRFYARRFLRLVPCMLLTVGIYSAWCVWGKGQSPWRDVILTLTYTANWARALFGLEMSYLGHTWSLAIEEQFYLIWPIAILLFERASRSAATKAWALFSLAACLALYRAGQVGSMSTVRIYFGIDTHMDALVVGSALSYLVKSLTERRAQLGLPRQILSWSAPLSIGVLFWLMRYVPWRDPFMARYGFFFAALATAVLLADLVIDGRSFLRPVFALGPLVFVGRISYGIYLLHYPIYNMVDRLSPLKGFAVAGGMKIALSLMAATISFYAIERHFLRLKRYFEPDAKRDAQKLIPTHNLDDPLRIAAGPPSSSDRSRGDPVPDCRESASEGGRSLLRGILLGFSVLAGSSNLAVQLGFPLRYTVWICAALALAAMWFWIRGGSKRPTLRRLSIWAGAISVSLLVALHQYLGLGLFGSLGSPHPDGWNHVARALFIWYHPWGEHTHLPVVFQYATHLAESRWGASSLLASLSAFISPGDPSSAITFFILVTAGATFLAFADLGRQFCRGTGATVAFACFATIVAWTPQIHAAGNYENALFLVYPPAMAALLLSLRFRQARIADGALASVYAVNAFAGYPEGFAPCVLFLLPFIVAVFVARGWRETLGRFFLPFTALFALGASPSILRFVRHLIRQIMASVPTAEVGTLRPGEGAFPGLLSLHSPASFISIGATETISNWWLLVLSFVVIPVLVFLGARELRKKTAAWAWSAVIVSVAAAVVGFWMHYDYGIYKLANISQFVWAPLLFSGTFHVITSVRRARVLATSPLRANVAACILLLVLGASKFAYDAPVRLIKREPFESIARDRALDDAGVVELRVQRSEDQLWLVYFLRHVPLMADNWRSYIGQPHVLPIVRRAESPRKGKRLFLEGSSLQHGRFGKGGFTLKAQFSAAIVQIRNRNGVDKLGVDPEDRLTWLGDEAAQFTVVSPEARPSVMSVDRVIFGPHCGGAAKVNLEITDVCGVREVEVTPTSTSFPICLREGTQEIVVRVTTPKKTPTVQGRDTRVLLLGLVNCSVR